MPGKIVPAAPVPPFVTFVTSAVPMVFDNSMSYYEALCALWKWLQDDVINVINNNATVTNEYIDLTNEYTEKFIELKNYVDTYFDNLDVQEEINNKLDEMVEEGTLQEIITTYIQSNVEWTFDTVADMKLATNLIDGSYAATLGFHNLNDGGGATYYISDTGTANEIDVIEVGDSLYAHLVKKPIMYVKQFGAAGNGTSDDTAAFDAATSFCKTVYVNYSANPYVVSHLLVPEGVSLIGEKARIQVNLDRGTDTVISRAYTNSTMKNIYINALDANKANNRFDIRESDNVNIENCRFDGFRDTNTHNAWGILLTEATNVKIDQCYFDNNTQSDIAVVAGCENIIISRCSGTSFHINFEPANEPFIYNCSIKHCKIAKLDLRENSYQKNLIRKMTVEDCTIDLLEYDGASVTFIDCVIKDYQEQQDTMKMGGQVKFINSTNFTTKLINDVYIDKFTNTTNGTTDWIVQAIPSSLANCFSYDKLNGDPVFVINPNYGQRTASIRHQDITVTAGKTYALRINASLDLSQGGANISLNTVMRFYDSSSNQVAEFKPSLFRGANNSVVPMHEETFIFKAPTDAVSLRLILRNADYGVQRFLIRSVELYEITSNATHSNEIPTPATREKRVWTDTAPTVAMNYKKGDIMYYTEPSTYIGKVCTTDSYSGTWKDFGALAA